MSSNIQEKQYVHISEWLKNNSSVEINHEIKKHKKIVSNLANKYSKYNSELYKDLYNEGILGLLLAMTKFDNTSKASLDTYAFYWVRSKMLNFIKKNNHNDILSMDHEINNGEGGVQLFQNIVASDYSSDIEINKNNLKDIMNIFLSELPTKQYIVMMNRYLTEPRKTFTEIASILGNSKQYVKKIELNALHKLKEIINKQEIKFSASA